MLAFQSLYARQFIGADRAFPFCMTLRRPLINRTNIGDLSRKIGVFLFWGRQPVADLVRLQIFFFNNRCACLGEIVVTISRLMISSAISRPVH